LWLTVSAFDFVGGFEVHLNPADWNERKLILFMLFFILTAFIESFFIKRKNEEANKIYFLLFKKCQMSARF